MIITPEITREEWAQRRKLLADKMPKNSIALLPGAKQIIRNNDAEYPFRQDSDFYYVTGFSEPGAFFVLRKKQDETHDCILFCEVLSREQEKWVGKKRSVPEALSQYGMDEAYPINELDLKLPGLLGGQTAFFYSLGESREWDTRMLDWVKNTCHQKNKSKEAAQNTWMDFKALIHEQRLIKSAAEIGLMQKAADISAEAHMAVMQHCKPQQKEFNLEGVFVATAYQAGCRSMAYMPIVGGGANACTLHYTENDQTLQAGDLVLVDAAVEYENYAADITRTFPVSGKFSLEQKLIYECVLKAQLAIIDVIRPGILWESLQSIAIQHLVEGLVSLKILKGRVEDLIAAKAYQTFYMHGSGHWLGLDVHDVGSYQSNGKSRALQAGMVLTVEPGLYLAQDELSIEARWRGIGVRIEDDVLVTETGAHVLSQKVPKTVIEIERLMQSSFK
jgi:Xaa-Pro aminopeptidase